MSLDCDELGARLSDLLDGPADERLQAEAAEHLATCEACRVVVDEVGEVRRLTREHGRLRLPDDARDRIRRALGDDA